MSKSKCVDVVFLLDRSGSMSGIEEDTIGGYNSYIDGELGKNVRVTTVLFDDQYELLTDRVPIKEVKKLTRKEYFVRGCTALLDAVGKTIGKMDSEKCDKVIFIITTDGLENASKEYNKAQIKKMIKDHDKWEFMYIGANIDSYSEGASIGINKKNISNYRKDTEGVGKLFKAMGRATQMYCEDAEISDSWKDELEDYVKNTNDDENDW